MPRPSGRDALLAAAERVAIRDGSAHLTLDAVAAEAGLSKGGVLYHFPNKSALLAGMLEKLLKNYEIRRDAAMAALGANAQECALRAELEAGLQDNPDNSDRQVGAAMLAVLANEPALIEQGRAFYVRRYERTCGKSMKDSRKALLLLALDGLKLLELLQLSPFNEKQRKEIQAQLLAEGERIAQVKH